MFKRSYALVDHATMRKCLSQFMPQLAEFLCELEGQSGRIAFRGELKEVIPGLKIETCPQLYKREEGGVVTLTQALFNLPGVDWADDPDSAGRLATAEQHGRFLMEFGQTFVALDSFADRARSPEDLDAAARLNAGTI